MYSAMQLVGEMLRGQNTESKKETVREFKDRLRKTAMSLPVSVVKAAVGSMRRRCKTIAKLKGELFTE